MSNLNADGKLWGKGWYYEGWWNEERLNSTNALRLHNEIRKESHGTLCSEELRELIEEYGEDFEVGILHDNPYDNTPYLIVTIDRFETPEEVIARLKLVNGRNAEKLAEQIEKAEVKKQKDLAELARLKLKYEDENA